MRRQVITSEDTKMAVEPYERGLTIKRVVERVGYSLPTLKAHALHQQSVGNQALFESHCSHEFWKCGVPFECDGYVSPKQLSNSLFD